MKNLLSITSKSNLMKSSFTLLTAALVLTVSSCQKAAVEPQVLSNDQGKVDTPEGTCPATEVNLIAGQTINSGTVTVTNDAAYIYVTYTTAPGWYMTQTHLFVGDCNAVPVNGQGNPMPGQFPYANNHNNATSYTYQVPISAIPAGGCGCIAAHAVVVQMNASGQVIQTQTGWGNGIRINPTGGNWGMKFSYCSCVQ